MTLHLSSKQPLCAVVLLACSLQGFAAEKPDTTSILKQHPEFVTLTRVTKFIHSDEAVRITFCRSTTSDCEVFESDADKLDPLADYAYLFAVYKGKYGDVQGTASKRKPHAADALLQEAQDKGYAKNLLDFYAAKYSCDTQKDPAGCVMHRLWKAAPVSRYVLYRGGHDYSIDRTDESGKAEWSD